MYNYDVIIIGGGPGGYVAAIRAASSGLRTALIEKDTLGGVCLNWGCIPTKALLRNAEVINTLCQSEIYGFTANEITINYTEAHKRSRQICEKLVNGIDYLMKKHQITIITDIARLTGAHRIELHKEKRSLTAKNIMIATGASPRRLPFLNYAQPGVLDSKKILQLTQAPKSLVIIGAGAIGMEFATIFSTYGTNICIVEAQDRVLPNEDTYTSLLIKESYEKRGIRIITGAQITAIEKKNEVFYMKLTHHSSTFTLETEYILLSIGISPNIEELGLDSIGLAINSQGFIITDDSMRTNIPSIYAIGDVTGKLALAHVASTQAIAAIEHILTGRNKPIVYKNIPKCIYTIPEVASVGLTLETAEEAGFMASTAVFPLSANGKAIAYGDDTGFAKLVYDKKYGQLLGVHITGINVAEMIWGAAGYLGMEMTIDEMMHIIHPHPTVSEVIMEAAYLACGKAIHI